MQLSESKMGSHWFLYSGMGSLLDFEKPLEHLCKCNLVKVGSSVANPDLFFTGPVPDPGIFFQSGSGFRIQEKNANFFKGNNKFWDKFCFQPIKYR